ncbi:MAG: hypothetical protein KF905_10455 [Flavobacteriales bacterium]|nr:hypothetical protein [Flavobacteriales bacterium]
MHWWPLLVRSHFSVALQGADEAVLERAQEVIMARGQQLREGTTSQRNFGPHWAQFILYHPYLLVSRTQVYVHHGRLHYVLHHPAALLFLLIALLVPVDVTRSATALIPLLLLATHSAFLFFVHRELIAQMTRKNDTGETLVKRADG